MADLQEVKFKISFSTKGANDVKLAVHSIKYLQKELAELQKTDLSVVKELAESLSGVTKAVDALNKAKTWNIQNKFENLQEEVSRTQSSVDKLKKSFGSVGENLGRNRNGGKPQLPENQQKAMEEAKKKAQEYAENLKKVDKVLNMLGGSKGNGGKLANLFSIFGKPEMALATKGINILVSSLQKLGSAMLNIGVAIATPFVKAIKNFLLLPFSGVKSVVDSLVKTVSGFIKRIGRLTVLKAIRKAISLVSEGIRTGIDNLYEYSRTFGGDFAKSLDSATTSMLYFKNSIGAMVAPLINALVPALQVCIDKIVDFLNAMNQLFAKLTGATTWTRALKYAKEYSSSVASGAKSAKDFTASFDELNVINDKSGGSGSAGDNFAEMFEEVALDNAMNKWLDHFKESIANGDWYGAGNILAKKFNGLIESIDTVELANNINVKLSNGFNLALGFLQNAKTSTIGVKIAEFFNTLFDGDIPYLIGNTFGTGLQRAIDIAYGFFTTFKWDKFGYKLSEYVRGWFDGLNGKTIGVSINSFINGVLDAITAFLKNEKMVDSISKTLGDIFKELDFETIITKAINIATLLYSILTDQKVIEKVARAINKILTSPRVRQALYGFVTVILDAFNDTEVGKVFNSVTGFNTGSLETYSRMRHDILDSENTASQESINMLGSVLNFTTALGSASNMVADELLREFSIIGKHGTETATNLKNSFTGAFGSLSTSLNAEVAKINKISIDPFSGISSKTDAFIKEVGKVPGAVKPAYNELIRFAETMANGTVTSFNRMLESFQSLGNTTVNGKKSTTIGINKVASVSIPRLAQGGMVSSGSLFYAGENGSPEVVGNVGGYSGVMNTQQMSEAVGRAVYEAMVSANRTSGDNSQSIVVNLDGRTIWTNQANITRERGYNLGLGGFNV